MNPVFLILVILGGVALWFLLAGIFPVLGGFFRSLWRDAQYNMTIDDEKENEETDA